MSFDRWMMIVNRQKWQTCSER